MAEVFILEFEGFDQSAYDQVNAELGIDMDSGEGDWPAGLHTHLAGPTEGGGWIVIEVWESQEDQDAFMQSRLSGALHKAGVTGPPKRAEWTKPRAHHSPKKASAKVK
ncbi:MAG TPA: hypothetical protein VMU65_15620 [Candidatus Saccharimonadales bacterium]|nr:hypothetical protein [Candidatus Saccharimonadales bacterium]